MWLINFFLATHPPWVLAFPVQLVACLLWPLSFTAHKCCVEEDDAEEQPAWPRLTGLVASARVFGIRKLSRQTNLP